MSVEIEPFELSFRRPFTVEVSRTLTIKNPNSTPVAFKVKTTAPKQYCVRPNAGRIEPGQEFPVTVLLQAMKADPAPDAKCRDKFLVQSATITPDKEFLNISQVLDSSEKGHVQEKKIRVSWLAANEDDVNAPPAAVTPSKPQSNANGVTDTPDASNTFSSPAAPAAAASSDPSPPPYTSEKSSPSAAQDTKAAISAAASNVSSTAAMTYDEIKNKLATAQAELVSLKDQGLRQRNVGGASGKTGEKDGGVAGRQLAQATKQTVEGVPVHLVAGLCLVSFLLAYFFF